MWCTYCKTELCEYPFLSIPFAYCPFLLMYDVVSNEIVGYCFFGKVRHFCLFAKGRGLALNPPSLLRFAAVKLVEEGLENSQLISIPMRNYMDRELFTEGVDGSVGYCGYWVWP